MADLNTRTARLAARWLFTALLVGLVVWSVDGSALWQELGRISPFVLLPAFALTVLQVALSAWRWRYTVERLGLSLPLSAAIREYYLATFLNQVLPGGVLGDVNRAWRHGREAGERLSAMHGVAIERLSGQLVLALAVVVSVSWLFQAGQFAPRAIENGLWVVTGIAFLAFTAWAALRTGLSGGLLKGLADYLRLLRRDLFQSLLRWPVLPVQIGSSLLVLASYLGVFLCLAWGAGYLNSLEAAAVIVALGSILLLSMVIPLTLAGWGIREGAAAVVWPMVGLPAEQGVALSVGYGALVLVSSLPGMVFIVVGKLRLA
ncbi:lysylphosphatidylglycerol synthase transmembrane domain-containing protein [Marinobacter sp.]|uniref:lysylphosphatidylglycerol synthase transmembrane domain-containing protein n=1 Tax=Marinobacter sp. TaxID=50741 RepID=UPI003A8D79E7